MSKGKWDYIHTQALHTHTETGKDRGGKTTGTGHKRKQTFNVKQEIT